MGRTLDAAMQAAGEALREFANDLMTAGEPMPPPRTADIVVQDPEVAEALRAGARLASIPLVRATARSTKANLSINAGLLAAIEQEAARQGVSRSAWIESMARDALASLA